MAKFKLGDKVKYVKAHDGDAGINRIHGFELGKIYTINTIEKNSLNSGWKLTFKENGGLLLDDEVELVTESKFKVGDKVRVRKDLTAKLYKSNDGDTLRFAYDMLTYRGRLLNITGLNLRGDYEVKETYWLFSDEMLELVIESPILDSVEFDYLWNIIKPFKDKVDYIKKNDFDMNKFFISITLGGDDIYLPLFPKDSSMYKGMKANKNYTLEELGFVKPKPKKLNCKAVCIESDESGLTVGKIYEFKDGKLIFDDGASTGLEYDSIENFNKCNEGWKLLEIKE